MRRCMWLCLPLRLHKERLESLMALKAPAPAPAPAVPAATPVAATPAAEAEAEAPKGEGESARAQKKKDKKDKKKKFNLKTPKVRWVVAALRCLPVPRGAAVCCERRPGRRVAEAWPRRG